MECEPVTEPHWPAAAALVACVALYGVLPGRLTVGPRWLLPVLVALPIIPLAWHRGRSAQSSLWARRAVLALVAVTTLANIGSVALLVHHLLRGEVTGGRSLIYSAIAIWLTNVILYALWFWEIDRGGPDARSRGGDLTIDLQFPQMENPRLAPAKWRPRFVDYLYTAYANASSFAPADAMPLTSRMKALFVSESALSLITIAIVASRAVNILR